MGLLRRGLREFRKREQRGLLNRAQALRSQEMPPEWQKVLVPGPVPPEPRDRGG